MKTERFVEPMLTLLVDTRDVVQGYISFVRLYCGEVGLRLCCRLDTDPVSVSTYHTGEFQGLKVLSCPNSLVHKGLFSRLPLDTVLDSPILHPSETPILGYISVSRTRTFPGREPNHEVTTIKL